MTHFSWCQSMALIEVKCPYCNKTEDVKKFGKSPTGKQRYRCFSCLKVFQQEYAYAACKPGTKEIIITMSENNMGIRGTARAMNISINSVVRALKKAKP